MKITICRKAHFNAAHKLYNPSLSNDENFEIFGKCSYENFHGHNYENLNLDIPHFKDVIPTTENLAIFIWNKLKSAIKIDCKLSIVLYETPRNYVEYSG